MEEQERYLKPVVDPKRVLGPGLALVALIFVADFVTPTDLTVSLAFLLPLLYVSRSLPPRYTYRVVALCSVLIAAGFLLCPPPGSPVVDIANRLLAMSVLWLTAVLLAQGYRKEGSLRDAVQRLQERSDDLSRAHQQLHALSHRLVEIQENERRAIARELHDEAGQALTSLIVGLGLIQRDDDCSEALSERVDELKHTTEAVMEELHRLSANLRPSSLDRLGLVPALHQYLDQFQAQHGIKTQMEVVGLENLRLPPDAEIALYRIVQECLTNVARHARATGVGLILSHHGDRVKAVIEDDGAGFDVTRALEGGRLGLAGMRERAEMLGGTLTVDSSPGSGTTIFVDVPAPRAPDAL